MVVFSLGMLVEKKGFRYLIEAISSVSEECPVFFAIGGEGPERERLEHLIEEYRVASLIKLIGRVTTHDVPVLLKRADIFVLPSIVDSQGETETLGVVLLEALASGTPCIASRVGGIVDIVEDGVNGFLTKPGNSGELAQKILLLLRDENLRLSMGKAGRKKVATHYTWDINAKRTEDVYRLVVNKERDSH
jgi:glycosyltransferase involved in cell wall biosynthesis